MYLTVWVSLLMTGCLYRLGVDAVYTPDLLWWCAVSSCFWCGRCVADHAGMHADVSATSFCHILTCSDRTLTQLVWLAVWSSTSYNCLVYFGGSTTGQVLAVYFIVMLFWGVQVTILAAQLPALNWQTPLSLPRLFRRY